MLDGFLFINKEATNAAPASHGAAVANQVADVAPAAVVVVAIPGIPDAPNPARVPRPEARDGSSIKSINDKVPPTVPKTLPILDIPGFPTFLPNRPTLSCPVIHVLG